MTVQQCPERVGAVGGLPLGRAARELELKPREFELAVQLGYVRTVAAGPGGRRRVSHEEIEKHKSGPGFPEALRTRLWVVGTADAAELLGISPARFVRLAKAGSFAPVRFYVNRYRAVVWHYLAADLVEFADANPDLLTGRTPAAAGAKPAEPEDRRARNWRVRRIGQLLSSTEDPWERAAVTAAALDPGQLADAVPDPHERACVSALRPDLAQPRPAAAAAREVADRVTLAAGADEIAWHRHRLDAALAEARAARPSPAPAGPPAVPVPETREKVADQETGRRPTGIRARWERLLRRKH
ncbi:DUF6397 family protein [Streptomyces sp. NPDC046215]